MNTSIDAKLYLYYRQHFPVHSEQTIRHYQKLAADTIHHPSDYPTDHFSGQGIVICAGGPVYFPCAWVCLNTLRHLGCTLPIEWWYLGPHEMNDEMIRLVSTLNVRCVDALKELPSNTASKIGSWELKPHAITHSRFEEVLYIDADNLPQKDPRFLFETTAYQQTGALFWPDRYQPHNTAPPFLRREAWDICQVPFQDEPEFETGQLVINKKRCWRALQFTCYLNAHPEFYYAYFYGDKDTFHLAWRKLNQDYALVPYGVSEFQMGMVQHDWDGHPLFIHRNDGKWTLKQNAKLNDIPHENDYHRFIQILFDRWSGIIYKIPHELTEAEQKVYINLVKSASWTCALTGFGAFGLRILPDLRIESPAPHYFHSLEIRQNNTGDVSLLIRSSQGGLVAKLWPDTSAGWTGRSTYNQETIRLMK